MTNDSTAAADDGKRPVDSAITQLLNHLEVAMWSQGVPPGTAAEVLNMVLFGHPAGPAAWEQLQAAPQGDRLGLLTAQVVEHARSRPDPAGSGESDRWEQHLKELLAQVFTLGLASPARQDTRRDPGDHPYGWVKGFQPLPGGSVLLRCHDPAGGPDVPVRVSRFELESMTIALTVTPDHPAGRAAGS